MSKEAYEALACADAAEDLERLATAAYMLGRGDDHVAVMERAHRAHLDRGDALRAARCAFWVGINLILRGETRAMGWFGRAPENLFRSNQNIKPGG